VEYIGELPCKACISALNDSIRLQKDSIDKAILKRLYRSYRPFNNLSKETIGRAEKSEKIFGSIRKYTYIPNGTVSYNVVYAKGITKRFKTFKEALQSKIDYCIKNNNHMALSQIRNKLKELQNEQ